MQIMNSHSTAFDMALGFSQGVLATSSGDGPNDTVPANWSVNIRAFASTAFTGLRYIHIRAITPGNASGLSIRYFCFWCSEYRKHCLQRALFCAGVRFLLSPTAASLYRWSKPGILLVLL